MWGLIVIISAFFFIAVILAAIVLGTLFLFKISADHVTTFRKILIWRIVTMILVYFILLCTGELSFFTFLFSELAMGSFIWFSRSHPVIRLDDPAFLAALGSGIIMLVAWIIEFWVSHSVLELLFMSPYLLFHVPYLFGVSMRFEDLGHTNDKGERMSFFGYLTQKISKKFFEITGIQSEESI
ncbi:hypothetical protein ADUPG1_011852 [Aduncisulcus paluster]|uniref:Uncharacterized protein n=1 Tax=Aduncisulcus paluster TaxID=2918883 RepID=A0ABQ5JY77_9EUKA|nr:hypothetical protein ADUPG1_011852 [Aduncisulcus paluster]